MCKERRKAEDGFTDMDCIVQVSNYIHSYIWDVVVRLCPSFNTDLASCGMDKWLLTIFRVDVIIHPYCQLNAGSAHFW